MLTCVAVDAVTSAGDRCWVSQVGGTKFKFEFWTVRAGGGRVERRYRSTVDVGRYFGGGYGVG
jgi:hypothetical protein